jgi:hypothetical protein
MISKNYLNIVIAILIIIVIVLVVLHYRKKYVSEKFEISPSPTPESSPSSLPSTVLTSQLQNYLEENIPLCFTNDREPIDILPFLTPENYTYGGNSINFKSIINEMFRISLNSSINYFVTVIGPLLDGLCNNNPEAMNIFIQSYLKIVKSLSSLVNRFVNLTFSSLGLITTGLVPIKTDDETIKQQLNCIRIKYLNLNDVRLADLNAIIPNSNSFNITNPNLETDKLFLFCANIVYISFLVGVNEQLLFCDNVNLNQSEYIIDRYKSLDNTIKTCLNRVYNPQLPTTTTAPNPPIHNSLNSRNTTPSIPFSTENHGSSLSGIDQGFSYGFASVGDITLIDSVGPNNFFQPNIRIT